MEQKYAEIKNAYFIFYASWDIVKTYFQGNCGIYVRLLTIMWHVIGICILPAFMVSPCDMPAEVLSSLLKHESPNGGLHWAEETNSMQSGWLTTIAVHNESHVAG